MRRFAMIFVLLCIVMGITAVLYPQEASLAAPDQPQQAARVAPETPWPDNIPFSVNVAADTCSGATNLVIPQGGGGDVSNVNFMTETSTDPQLTCAWGNPPAPRGKQGYRTVWYKFTAPSSGIATVDTYYSTYDTILAVYQGSCDALTMLACSDDYQGFSSRASFPVTRNKVYYIEVADWQSNTAGTADLSLAVWIESVESRWEMQPNMAEPISRHALVSVGTDIYTIGGVTEMGVPLTLSSSLLKLDTNTGNWITLQSIPGTGYANTTAVAMDGRIFLPGGYAGNNTLFDGTHWAYTISSGLWSSSLASPPWPGGKPLAWGTAVASQSTAIPKGYFLIGGTDTPPPFDPPYNSYATPSSEVLFYYLDNNTWTATTFPDLETARYGHTAAWVQDRVCVVGGIGINDSDQNVLLPGGECYKPGSGSGWLPIGNMTVPRHSAGSAVGPDGKWYVFGGVDSEGNAVEFTEVYNPATGTWSQLGAAYDLGDFDTAPPRGWPRGAFVGDVLWAIGGHDIGPEASYKDPLNLVSKLELIVPSILLPVIFSPNGSVPANNTFTTAYALNLNEPQYHNFDVPLDVYDTYYFDLFDTRPIVVRLTEIPQGSEYNLAVYSSNKLLWGEGNNPGSQDEAVPLTLTAGRYYIVVHRAFPAGPPNTANYRISVEG